MMQTALDQVLITETGVESLTSFPFEERLARTSSPQISPGGDWSYRFTDLIKRQRRVGG